MAIHGAVAYRANKLKMVNGKLVVTSPSWERFHWPEPVMWAKCGGCPKDDDGHIMSDEDCGCGIYSATNLETISYYVDGDNYVPILVEALGTYWFHWKEDRPEIKGLTSSGVQVAAVISDYRNWKVDTPQLWITALANFYDVRLGQFLPKRGDRG
jgi:hypothetical protein